MLTFHKMLERCECVDIWYMLQYGKDFLLCKGSISWSKNKYFLWVIFAKLDLPLHVPRAHQIMFTMLFCQTPKLRDFTPLAALNILDLIPLIKCLQIYINKTIPYGSDKKLNYHYLWCRHGGYNIACGKVQALIMPLKIFLSSFRWGNFIW